MLRVTPSHLLCLSAPQLPDTAELRRLVTPSSNHVET